MLTNSTRWIAEKIMLGKEIKQMARFGLKAKEAQQHKEGRATKMRTTNQDTNTMAAVVDLIRSIISFSKWLFKPSNLPR